MEGYMIIWVRRLCSVTVTQFFGVTRPKETPARLERIAGSVRALMTVVGAVLAASPALARSAYSFSLDADYGRYAVGLKVVEQYDYSRTFSPPVDQVGKPFSGERARPIQTLIWYPAEKSAARHMTVGDYITLGRTEVSFGHPHGFDDPADYFTSGIRPTYPDPMVATRDAAPVPQRFPVVIYAASFSSSAWENADLCEYLASFGYIVIASPGMGVGHDSTHDLAGANAQATDISFLIGYSRTLPDADTDHVAVVGFSWGGLSNLIAAAHDNRIQALADLDGSIRYWPGLVKAAGIDPSQMGIPLLYLKSQDTLEDQARLETDFSAAAGPSVLNNWTGGDLISVQMLQMVHPEFGSMVFRNRNLWEHEYDSLRFGDFTREDGVRSYAWAARYTREFLDAYLKREERAMAFLKSQPAEAGVPPHILGVRFQAGRSKPFDQIAFRQEVAKAGFDRLADVYAAARKDHPDFKLSGDDLTSWAWGLMYEAHQPEALAVAKLAAEENPSSNWVTNTLAAAYLRSGHRAEAIATYRRLIQNDPANVFAATALTQLDPSFSKAR
jgi:dienelactone hydrolase